MRILVTVDIGSYNHIVDLATLLTDINRNIDLLANKEPVFFELELQQNGETFRKEVAHINHSTKVAQKEKG